jgi:DNA polymerase-3 subunit epsilon
VLGLEKTGQGKPCFAYQLKKCRGACVGHEHALEHSARLLTAMHKLKLATWPYQGAIGIRENEDLHVIDHWCYLGTARSESEIEEILSAGRPAFDRDTYQMLSKTLKKCHVVRLN